MRARYLLMGMLLLTVAHLPSIAQAAEDEDDPARQHRWADLKHAVFAQRPVEVEPASAHLIALEAPARALDAALVPVTVTVSDPSAKGIYLLIDDNPSPLAAHVVFGPAIDPRSMSFRVRVNTYTFMHAVLERADGSLIETARFVKASGGCSAPAGSDAEEALQNIGKMKLKLAGTDSPLAATLMIRHPNFNGMQMDPLTQAYTPAHYVQKIKATYDGKLVFSLDTDISMASDPVLGFFLRTAPGNDHSLTVSVLDNQDEHWEKTFPVVAPGPAPVAKPEAKPRG
ncbi:putative secreted protein [Granulibacter bethesdensis]|uniref:Secreted protein n=1 Tax=Granulibacter bethesdensis TaxID=364410 RepID=A0AAC9KC04_9PROT|nr:quinoprotein dehydrogenase-associated SoxYZ-like carrier [Granulibacter bethesdensis]APH55646.1 putative secreted protein [Granulibacter bethesdensis]APH63231.1 putative secreted protein [Granulibacter bethesdensis]